MPPPRPPSRIEPLSFPVFGISWYADPTSGRSIVAYCGGGGSAKTGVNNSVVIFGEQHGGPRQLSTDEEAGSTVKIYQNPISHKVWMMVNLGRTIRRYAVDRAADEEADDEAFDVINVAEGEYCLALAVNSMASQLAFGYESGKVAIFETSDDRFSKGMPFYVLKGHENAVCALDYASRSLGRLISSAKDGTACLWNDGHMVAGLRCSVDDPTAPKPKFKPKKPPQILVRGCAFGDMEGRICYTVASARRGKAFLAQWQEQPAESGGKTGEPPRSRFVCVSKTACSDVPISAMSLSTDLSLLVMGSTEGTVILWSVEDWKPLKSFPEVHDLPVTCIAARPFYSMPGLLQDEQEDGVMIHARSASADSQLGCLTAQRRAPRKRKIGDDDDASWLSCSTLCLWMHRLLILYILSLIFAPVFQEARDKCRPVWEADPNVEKLGECLLHKVLWAPAEMTRQPY